MTLNRNGKVKKILGNADKYAIQADLTVIGAGLAGLSAALFSVNRGITTLLVGSGDAFGFASGLMDLLGVYPEGMECLDPWAALEKLQNEEPGHPYGKTSIPDISDSFGEVADFLKTGGLPYQRAAFRNVNVMTSLGTVKTTHMVPDSMWPGVIALETKRPTLLVDFSGMKLYSARQIRGCLKDQWHCLSSVRLDFPGSEEKQEIYPEQMARALDVEEHCMELAKRVLPHLNGAAYVGFPAMLGMYQSGQALKILSEQLGVPVFEIPTPPVSVPGIRLEAYFRGGLEKKKGFRALPGRVRHLEKLSNGNFSLRIQNRESGEQIESKGVLLAPGRFLGKGLIGYRTGIRETLLDLPVTQPDLRKLWHNQDLFHPGGHPVNRAGIEIDGNFRPLTRSNSPFSENLFAAGSILAHADWMRMKCGSGVAVATAFSAVNSFIKGLTD